MMMMMNCCPGDLIDVIALSIFFSFGFEFMT